MANYSLVIDSTFKPFTYDELMAPVKRMSDVHDQIAAQYDELSAKADILEALGERDRQSGAYSQYKAYSDQLRNEADTLMREGLTGDSKARLMGMRRNYNKTIVPIQNAWNKREEEAKEQQKLIAANPSIMFTRTAADTSIDDYLANPTGGYGVVNGALIRSQMGDMAKNLAKQIRESGIKIEDLDPLTQKVTMGYGLTAAEIDSWIADPSSSPTLTNMMNQVLAANGVTPETLQGSRNAAQIMKNSIGYAQMGAWDALGEDKQSLRTNELNKMYLQNQFEIEKENRAAARAAAQAAGEANYPKLTSTNTGVEATEAYTSNGLAALNDLKTGYDGVKSSYFGKKMGEVNPMAIYEEYQKEVDKALNDSGIAGNPSNGIMSSTGSDMYKPYYNSIELMPQKRKEIKEKILNKYKQYGITDILSDRQYDILKGMGFNNKSKFESDRWSTYANGFNNLVLQKTAYDVPMADGAYTEMDKTTKANLMYNENSLGSKVYEYKGFKKGKGVGKLSDVGINKDKPKDSANILTIGYDPNHKGYIRVSYDNGKTFLMDPEIVGGAKLAEYLKRYEEQPVTNRITGESRMAYPEEIASGLVRFINGYNQGLSSSSSNAFE